MSGNNSQNTQSYQSQNQNFSDVSNMLEQMASQGTTNTQQAQNTNTAQNQNTANNLTGATTGTNASTTNPWGVAVPAVSNLVTQLGGLGTGLTPDQQAALKGYSASTGSMPNVGPTVANTLGNLFASNNGIPESGIWGGAYGDLLNTTSPFTGANWATINNPAINQMINDPNNGLNKNIATSIASQFAGAGRDPAGNVDASKAIASAESQADLPILLNNQNTLAGQTLNAAGQRYAAGAGTASGVTGLMQTPLTNGIAGINLAGSLPGLWNQGAVGNMASANAGYAAPYQNIGLASNLLTPLAGLGSSTSGATTGTNTQAQTGTTQQVGTQDVTGTTAQQTTKQATGQSQGNQSGQSSGTSYGNSTTTSPVNPWTTAAGIGLGLFAMS